MRELAARYQRTRRKSEELCGELAVEDHVVQSMPDVSPPKWHLGHTTWFFERFVLEPARAGYRPYHPLFNYVFNSYYEAAGTRLPRCRRGQAARPTLSQVHEYRQYVDRELESRFDTLVDTLASRIELGLSHEEQHQELLLTDIKHNAWCDPLHPDIGLEETLEQPAPGPGEITLETGLYEIGHSGPGFAYDNEGPRHPVFVTATRLAPRLVTNAQYLEFVLAGGYDDPRYWLSDGWRRVCEERWKAPLYWHERSPGDFVRFTLGGDRPLAADEPVSHVSYYEADAYARFRGARLPTESEWECAARLEPKLCGPLWQWTVSSYLPYPGYRPLDGAMGEYNGKFMSGLMVLRGGSWATPPGHLRLTYRNYFAPYCRWQFTGIRLAR